MKKAFFTLSLLFTTLLNYSQTPCSSGTAGSYPCDGITLQGYISASAMGAKEGQDSWGWTDPQDGKEYAIVALDNGTAFVNITDPINPIYLGRMDSHTGSSLWRDVKVYANHSYTVSDSNGNHGMQVFDLTQLRGLTGSPVVNFSETAHYNGFGSAHNIVINQDTGFAYVVGSNTFSGGPHFIDLSNPSNPVAAGGYSGSGYMHDAQILVYNGPDTEHNGKELIIGAFSGGSDDVRIIDVSDKNNINLIGIVSYSNKYYTHQGWFTDDKRFFIVGDEVDEENVGFNTRTLVFDMQDLDNPTLHYIYYGSTKAIDHNGYVRGNRFYLANYAAGMRILKIDGLYDSPPSMVEVNYFDVYPSSNSASFNGTWNVYPFFESGNLVVTGFGNENIDGDGGLFILKDPLYDNVDPTVVCQPYTAVLDKTTGSVTVNYTDIDGGTTDNFAIIPANFSLTGQTTFTCDDIGIHNITLNYEDDYGNKSFCVATITVEAETTSYLGGSTWSNGFPDIGSNVNISNNYNTTSVGNSSIDACTCEIDLGKTLTIGANSYLNLTKDIIVNGNLKVEHEGSLVQINDNATVTNNGIIEVKKSTTGFDDPTDFTILSSPMSSEVRNNVYASSAVTMNHITTNFIPHPDVQALDPAINNFADDNGDNWEFYTSNESIIPGVGYLVGGTTGGGNINSTYTQGTLNNGVITFPIVYNGTQNGSPNILGNPYASAIDGVKFINDNPIVDAIYYWEHLTAPAGNYPGYRSENWNMGDISILNSTGGIGAVNGGITPSNYIPSGQGFGVKANAVGAVTFNNSMRVKDNNTGYRDLENPIEKILLKVTNQTYQLKSSALIGFTNLATDEFDPKYDAIRLGTPLSIYSILDDKELTIQGRAIFNVEQIIPLGFRTMVEEQQEYSITLSNIEGESLNNVDVFLNDRDLNTITNLSETNYNFHSTEGFQNNRFYLFFESNEVLIGPENVLNTIIVYPNPTQDIINIDSPQSLIKSIDIYDLSGRKILSKLNVNKNSLELNFSSFKTTIYFVKIQTEFGTITKRVIKK
ncbi:MAG: choice-of-anchor B family protein [Flavobacteriaceae bacterium]